MRGVVVVLLVMTAVAGCFGPEDPSGVADPIIPPKPTAQPPVPPPPPPPPKVWPWYPNDGASVKESLELESFDDHLIPITVYKPAIANATTQFPIILHSHGFGGKRASADDAFKPYIEAGFGVVSMDQRGHGDARDTSYVGFMQPDEEIADVRIVIDHVASMDWVLLEDNETRDPLLGTIGGSYGGAFQLMTGRLDGRIDAMVPEKTWSNITEALAPNGAIKAAWVDLYYASGNAQGTSRFNDAFHQGFAWAVASNELPAGQLGVVPDLVATFNRASPDGYAVLHDAPTLLVQGMPDTLFPLNDAVHNYKALTAAGVTTYLNAHNQGHLIHTDSLAPGTSPTPVGLQGAPGKRPCGLQQDLDIKWHQKHLLGLDVDTGPKVCIALEDDTAIVGNRWPLPWTDMLAVDLGGPYPVAQTPGGYVLPLQAYDPMQDSVVAGIPRLSGRITSPGADAILYFSFYMARADGVMEHIVNDQVMPLRIKGPNTGAVPFSMELGGIATRLTQDDLLFLVVSTVEPIYMGGQERIPGGLVIEELHLELPVVQFPVYKRL